MRHNRIGFAAVIAIAVLGLSACGSSSGDESDAAATTAAPVATTAEATTEPAAAGTIVEVASSNPDFSTLVAAVKAAGLAETLSGTGPFTVFAPTNEAFEALPAGLLD